MEKKYTQIIGCDGRALTPQAQRSIFVNAADKALNTAACRVAINHYKSESQKRIDNAVWKQKDDFVTRLEIASAKYEFSELGWDIENRNPLPYLEERVHPASINNILFNHFADVFKNYSSGNIGMLPQSAVQHANEIASAPKKYFKDPSSKMSKNLANGIINTAEDTRTMIIADK